MKSIPLSNSEEMHLLYGTKRAKTVEKKDLCIQDLGYFSLDDFEEMERRGAFYVSRLVLSLFSIMLYGYSGSAAEDY